jgi:hypothetical protein
MSIQVAGVFSITLTWAGNSLCYCIEPFGWPDLSSIKHPLEFSGSRGHHHYATNGTVLSAPATFDLRASVAGGGNNVAQIEFLNGTNSLAH